MDLSKSPLMLRMTHALVLLAAFGLASCGGGAVPRDNYYRLVSPTEVATRTGGPLSGAAEVQPLRADGLLNDRAILFREGPSSIQGYSYHFWWQAPGSMLQQSLIDDLRRAFAFDMVAGPEMKLDRAYDVIGRIRRLEQGPASVVVELELSLRSARGGAPLLLKTYTEEVPTADGTVPTAVSAFSTALDRIWADFVTDLGTISPPQPAK
ncbi:MAG: hypothetical protein EPO08_12670 [Rhodospirillaceae bacterium]|nr:MAG: hypothetical protein EPO08_12670 [Rhodospirillaceae bacterium]